MTDTVKIIHALEQGIEAHKEMINLIKTGNIIIDTMERVSMLSIALGAMYHAYTNEVVPLMRSQNPQSVEMN